MRKIAREENMENFRYRRYVATLAVAFAVAGGSSSAQADTNADFYKSKGLRLVVGYGPGGGYDTYGRFLARHWGRHLPGSPNIIVVNMPGAGSRKATDHIYNAAPKDGSVVGLASKAIPGYQMFGGTGARWDSLKLSWIGRMDGGNGVMYMWHASGIKSIEDAKKKIVRVGATSRTTDSYFYPVIANAFLNTQFKVITGYTGGSKSLDLAGNTWASTKSRNSDWLRDGKMKIIFQVGIEKEADLPNVPLLRDLIADAEARSVLSVIELPTFTGYSIMGPPALPPDRLMALRTGFNAAMKDPGLIADAKKLDLSLSPATGQKIDQTLAEIAAKISPATKAEVAKILGWTEKKKKKK
jgi:tripartite-type tricarboxylate transporter receptor subunit TctC